MKYVDEQNDQKAYDDFIVGLNDDQEIKEEYVTKEDTTNDYIGHKGIESEEARKLCKVAIDFSYFENPKVRNEQVLFASSTGVALLQETKFLKYGMWLEITKHLAIFISVLALILSIISLLVSIPQ